MARLSKHELCGPAAEVTVVASAEDRHVAGSWSLRVAFWRNVALDDLTDPERRQHARLELAKLGVDVAQAAQIKDWSLDRVVAAGLHLLEVRF